MVFTACSKDEDPPADTGGGSGALADKHWQATIDGQVITVQNLGIYDNIASREYLTGNFQELQKMHIVNTADPTADGAGISIVKSFGGQGTCAQIQGMFAVGSYTYGNTLLGVDGAKVFHVDSNGEPWATDFSTADQTGSTFEIISHAPSGDTLSMYISEMNFSCTLYNINGASKTLTNGYMKTRSGKCP